MTSTPKTTGEPPHPSLTAGSWRSRIWALKRQQLLRSEKPILVGPWLSEVGFETLYWIPFLERLVQDGLDRSRLIPISRGGASAWYGTETGLEIYAMRSPQEVRVELRQRFASARQSAKQLTWTPFERQLVKDAAETLKLRSYLTLHPRWMYHVLSPFWEGHLGLAWLQQRTAFATLPAPPLPDTVRLPEQFVTARFYIRPTFTDKMTGMAISAVKQLAGQMPVVMLSSGFQADDHRDLEIVGDNVLQLADLASLNPETNLAVQSAVLARSTAFVGTYGGFAQLALRLGRPVSSYYETWHGTMIAHKHLADTLGTIMGVPCLVTGMRDLPLLMSATPVPQIRQDMAPAPVKTA